MKNAQLLTVRQAATQLQLSERTVRRAITAGELAVHRIGAAVRISEADLSTWIASKRQG